MGLRAVEELAVPLCKLDNHRRPRLRHPPHRLHRLQQLPLDQPRPHLLNRPHPLPGHGDVEEGGDGSGGPDVANRGGPWVGQVEAARGAADHEVPGQIPVQ